MIETGGGDPPPRPPQPPPVLRVSAVLKDMRDLLPSSFDAVATADHCRCWLLSLVGRGVLTILPAEDAPRVAFDAAPALNVSLAELVAAMPSEPPVPLPPAGGGGWEGGIRGGRWGVLTEGGRAVPFGRRVANLSTAA